MKYMAWAILILIVTMTLLVVCVLASHAQTAIVGPDGRITYIVPYGPGLPLAIIPPGGRVYHAIPMTPPSAYVPPPVYVPPTMPTFTPPSFNSPSPYGGY